MGGVGGASCVGLMNHYPCRDAAPRIAYAWAYAVIVVNAISTLVVARVGTPRRAGVVLGIGIARARAQAPPARHSTGYHSTDDAHAPLCTEQFVACCPLHTGLAAILGGLQYYKYAQVTRDKSARLSSPMRLRLHR